MGTPSCGEAASALVTKVYVSMAHRSSAEARRGIHGFAGHAPERSCGENCCLISISLTEVQPLLLNQPRASCDEFLRLKVGEQGQQRIREGPTVGGIAAHRMGLKYAIEDFVVY